MIEIRELKRERERERERGERVQFLACVHARSNCNVALVTSVFVPAVAHGANTACWGEYQVE